MRTLGIILAVAILGCGKNTTGSQALLCGPGTHEEKGVCVVNATPTSATTEAATTTPVPTQPPILNRALSEAEACRIAKKCNHVEGTLKHAPPKCINFESNSEEGTAHIEVDTKFDYGYLQKVPISCKRMDQGWRCKTDLADIRCGQ